MKPTYNLLLAIFLSHSFLGQAQIDPKTTIKKPPLVTTKINTLSEIPTLKKTDLSKLESAKIDLSKAKPIKVDKDLLTLSSSKKYRITPKNPYVRGLSFSFYGNYSPEAFTVSPRPSELTKNAYSRNDYYTYSGFIVFNASPNKEYRVKIELAALGGSGKISINDQQSSVSNMNRAINYVFRTGSGGQHIIPLSPYQRNGAVNPEDFKITSIQIDELAD